LSKDKKTCNCPTCGNNHPINDNKILKRIQERITAQKQFGNFVVIHRSHVKGLDDIVFFHCKSVRSAKYELTKRINNMKVDPNDWSQHLDFVFVAEPVVVLYQKKEEKAQIDISTILGKITFSKSLIKKLYWKADYHGLDCSSSSCSCKETKSSSRKLPTM
jgi:hypothetical protein